MSVPPSEGSTSPMNLPDKPVVGILGTAIEGRGNPGGFGISDPFDVRLTEAIAQARTLATDEESVLEFPTPLTAPVELPASSSKPLVPLIGGITLVTKDEWSAWTGGKPSHTWTGLDSSIALLEHTSPNQLRPVYVSAAQKGYNFRRTGHKILSMSLQPRKATTSGELDTRSPSSQVMIRSASRMLFGNTSRTPGWTPLPTSGTQLTTPR
jgi:hypothetical protein